MPVTKDRPGPYAPPSAILSVVQRHRSRGMPAPIDADVLARAGISSSLIPRTLQSLQALDLINGDGSHTQVLEDLRLAPEAEYKQRMADWLRATYADALSYVDPATDDEIRIRDAFRSYNPVGQQSRMVSLFMGLFTAAGVMPERQKPPSTRKVGALVSAATKSRAAVVAASTRAPNRRPLSYGGGRGEGGGAEESLPPALTGLLQSLPKNGEGWTQDRRDKFVATLGAVIDFCFPIVEAEVPATEMAADQ